MSLGLVRLLGSIYPALVEGSLGLGGGGDADVLPGVAISQDIFAFFRLDDCSLERINTERNR
jgi:hypothetical protein